MKEVSLKNKKRIGFLFLVIMVFIVLLCFRLAWIQIVDGDKYSEMAIEQQTHDVPIEARRGSVLDCNGTELATSATCYTLWVRPGEMAKQYKDAELEKIAKKVSKLTSESSKDILKCFKKNEVLVRVTKYIEKEEATKIRELDVTGLELAESTKRYYPMGNFASQLLGSVTDDNNGRTGIELEYDQYLSGISGRWIKNTDINGDELSFGTESYYEATDGYNVVMTIDKVIQYYVESALKTGMENTKADRIMCIVMDPKTGDVLAMAVTPGFNPNNATQPAKKSARKKFNSMSDAKQIEYLNAMWRNPLVNDTYEPGSTFKLLTASSALEEGVVSTTEKFSCGGSINVDGTTLHCDSNRAHGTQQLRDAIGNSCNVVHVKLALRLGVTKFYEYLALYGITDITGIDYPGEAGSIIQQEKGIGNVELATMAYGQGIAVTPIQLITAVSAIGNDGILMQPRLVKELTDSSGKTVQKFPTKKVRRVLSKDTAEEMCSIMEYEVASGGGGTAKLEGYRVGGKTGTANKAIGGTYSNEVYSSFMSMAPMDDPQVAVLVICDNPKGVRYGSYTAAPVAKDILSNTLRYLEVEPQYSSSEAKNIKAKYSTVPSITKKKVEEAIGIVAGKGLKYKVIGTSKSGDTKVVDQYPEAGEQLAKNGTVYIYTE